MDRRSNTRKWLVPASIFAYITAYLFTVGDIGIGRYGRGWQVVESPFIRMIEMRRAFQFEAIAMAELERMILFISPGNLLIAATLGSLLALNIDGILDLRERTVCSVPGRLGTSAGALPALLAGGACCAPGILLLIGIPGLGVFIGLFAWLIPLSIVILAVSRYWQRKNGAGPILTLF